MYITVLRDYMIAKPVTLQLECDGVDEKEKKGYTRMCLCRRTITSMIKRSLEAACEVL